MQQPPTAYNCVTTFNNVCDDTQQYAITCDNMQQCVTKFKKMQEQPPKCNTVQQCTTCNI